MLRRSRLQKTQNTPAQTERGLSEFAAKKTQGYLKAISEYTAVTS
jgi:hypothetical protein